jgi:hypothetical protein
MASRLGSTWVRHGHERRLRSPAGYLLAAVCKDRMWIGHCRDPEQTELLLRRWCPWPIHHITKSSMDAAKAEQLVAAISPWRVRRGSNWFRTPPEMTVALDQLAAEPLKRPDIC